jgi:hypothetical protein
VTYDTFAENGNNINIIEDKGFERKEITEVPEEERDRGRRGNTSEREMKVVIRRREVCFCVGRLGGGGLISAEGVLIN